MLKITQLLDWQAIEHTLASKKVADFRDHGGRPPYPLLPMFRAILLGQWHNFSDSELECSPVTRLDFMIFCQFPDEMNLPDHSTFNRFRHRLMQDGLLNELNQQINRQPAQNKLKVEKAQTAIEDATIIQTADSKLKKAIEVSENTEQTENKNKPKSK